MANSPVVSSLPAYVEQNREPIIANTVLGGKTIATISVQTGVKGTAAINIISTDVQFADGKTCGWAEKGTQTMTQRNIVTGVIKINMAYCDRAVIGKWAESQINIAAGRETLPFEEKFVEGLRRAIAQELDKCIWQGNKSSGSTDNLKMFDGFVKILTDDSEVVDVTVTSATKEFEAVQQVVKALPAAAIAEDTVIFCSPEFLMAYGQEMVNKNLFHFEPGRNYDEFVVPGTTIRLVAVVGLTGANKLVAGRASNFVYGCDLESASEEFKLWYSDDNDEFRLKVLFNAGVQVAFPDQVVLADLQQA